jgi:hypothetical protein
MDDGTFTKYGVRIATYNFTYKEHQILVLFFKEKYDLNCTIQKLGSNYALYFKADSLYKLRNLVNPYIIPSMIYKIGLK